MNEEQAQFHDFGDGRGPVPIHRHGNGDGWVADSATVNDSAFIGPSACVFGRAKVLDNASVTDSAQVCGDAVVAEDSRVSGDSLVEGNAQILGHAEVGGNAHIAGTAVIRDYAWITGDTQVMGDQTIGGGTRRCELPRVSLGPMEVTDGAGWAPPLGSTGTLAIFHTRVTVGDQRTAAVVDFTSLRDVRIGGNAVTTGGRFFGGGFGAKAAVEGMLVAGVLNSLTTKTNKWVVIGIATDDGWVEIRLPNRDVAPIKSALRILSDWVVINQRRTNEFSSPGPTSPASEADDLVSQLERLAMLRDAGALSEDEFTNAKVQLLKG